jgi:hypothetical protein
LNVVFNCKLGLVNAAAQQPAKSNVRVNRCDLAYALGIMLQVEPRPDADLEDSARSVLQQFVSMPAELGLSHHQVA